jgi:hypothetical protein
MASEVIIEDNGVGGHDQKPFDPNNPSKQRKAGGTAQTVSFMSLGVSISVKQRGIFPQIGTPGVQTIQPKKQFTISAVNGQERGGTPFSMLLITLDDGGSFFMWQKKKSLVVGISHPWLGHPGRGFVAMGNAKIASIQIDDEPVIAVDPEELGSVVLSL